MAAIALVVLDAAGGERQPDDEVQAERTMAADASDAFAEDWQHEDSWG
jgi:hypothetical protein